LPTVYCPSIKEKINQGIKIEELTRNQMLTVVLYDMYGFEIFAFIVVKNEGEVLNAFDLSGKLSSGIYLVKGTSDPEIFGRKMVIN